MNLIEQLKHGTTEYINDTVRVNPPNRLMLQATKVLEQVEAINATNGILIHQLQVSEHQNLEIIEALRKEIEQLKIEQKTLYGTIYDYESLRNSGQETNDMGVGDVGRAASPGLDASGETVPEADFSVSDKSDYFAGGVNETNS